jgi:hypothetical protein
VYSELEGGGETFKGERDREDVGEMVERGHGGGLKDTAHLAEGVILGNCEGEDERFATSSRGIPNRSTICEDGKYNHMEHPTPVGEQKPPNGVS